MSTNEEESKWEKRQRESEEREREEFASVKVYRAVSAAEAKRTNDLHAESNRLTDERQKAYEAYLAAHMKTDERQAAALERIAAALEAARG